MQQKSEFDELTSMEKDTQLLLIKHIRQSKKIDKVGFYHFISDKFEQFYLEKTPQHFTNFCNKLECLSLASPSSLV
jgi:hypothetical protein